jgi:hypothetical protein
VKRHFRWAWLFIVIDLLFFPSVRLWRISASSHVDLIISFSGILSPSEAVIRRRKRGFVGFTSDHSHSETVGSGGR